MSGLLTLSELGLLPPECWGERCDMSNSPKVVQQIKELCSEELDLSSLDPWPPYFGSREFILRNTRKRKEVRQPGR
jgi:hypothetical protein